MNYSIRLFLVTDWILKTSDVWKKFFRDLQTLLGSGDKSGSLIKFDPRTMETSMLMRNLAVPFGVAVSKDGSYVLVSEYMANRVQRFWLKGDKQNTSEIFLQLLGKPHNIKRNSAGEFWVAFNNRIRSNCFCFQFGERRNKWQSISKH